MLMTMSSEQLSKRAAFFFSSPKNFFLFLHLIFKLFFVLLFLDFGDFLLKAALAGMGET